jgi:adenylate cyclase
MLGVQIWRSGSVQVQEGELESHAVNCLCLAALSEWYFGDIASCQADVAEAISLTKELNDSNARAMTLCIAAFVGNLERDPAEVVRVASDLIELSTIQNFAHWLALGTILRGWAQSALGHITEGIAQIENGIEDYRVSGSIIDLPLLLSLKAEALHLADRTVEALEAIKEAEEVVEISEAHWRDAELYRLRGVFLAALGSNESQIEASFQAAIRIATEQKSVSLEKRAEATYAEYRHQKASGSGGHGFRLPLW